MVTVSTKSYEVEDGLRAGRLACPGCGQRLGPWGHARPRLLRGESGCRWRLRPRRARCSGCGRTHVLLPVSAFSRRADAAAVIGAALVAKASGGAGHRRIADRLGRPAATVRGWLRRFAARAVAIRDAFTTLACALETDPVLPGPGVSPVADAVAAIGAAATAMVSRWGAVVRTVSGWELASAVSAGALLAPGEDVELSNTSRPFRPGQ